jgi:hypothetical protein
MSVDVRCTTRTEIGRMTQAVRELLRSRFNRKMESVRSLKREKRAKGRD